MSETGRPTTKKFRRKLTPFLCREMLYDYATGSLDADRRVAVEEFLDSDEECQTILDEIRKGLGYADGLAAIQIKPAVLSELKDAESAASLSVKYASWREWPETLRWSLTAVMASMVLAGLVAVVPWKSIPVLRSMIGSDGKGKKADVIEIAQLTRPLDEAQLEALQEQQEGEVVDEGSGDEEMDASGDDAAADEHAVVAAVPTPPPAVALAAKPGPTPNLLQASPGQVAPVPPGKEPAPKPVASADPEKAQAPSSARESKPKGYVNRAFMTLGNLDELGPKIVDHIVELGGEKAGEVELGWKRGTGRYYHFSMPEENQEKLLEKLRAYGPVRISRDPHPRVMPQGQVRFILWVEAGDSQ